MIFNNNNQTKMTKFLRYIVLFIKRMYRMIFNNNNHPKMSKFFQYVALFTIGLVVELFLINFCIPDAINGTSEIIYQSHQEQTFAQPTLKQLNFDYANNTTASIGYQKNKSMIFKKSLLANALKKNDLHTLVQVYQKDPNLINKAYLFACIWNTKYDNAHQSKYAYCLIYYNRHFTKSDQELISPFLKEIINTCISDPTGYHTLHEFLRTKSKSQIVWPK